MKKEIITRLHSAFEDYANISIESGLEFWYARDLQQLLGYREWRNFEKVILRAKTACGTAGHEVSDHFVSVNKMVDIGSGSQREVGDIALTRYACYLIAQNGDPRKTEIAFAQTYFAIQTRRQELIEKRLAEIERLQARRKLTNSEKELSKIIYERIQDERSFAFIRSRGDEALFGGVTTRQMKEHMGIPLNRPLADFLPTITIKAKDFANEITNFKILRDDLLTEKDITEVHVDNNIGVREILIERAIRPEDLPPAEDTKKVERRLKSEEKKLLKQPRQGRKKKAKKLSNN
jgi:DNA-damage-inducible protein D